VPLPARPAPRPVRRHTSRAAGRPTLALPALGVLAAGLALSGCASSNTSPSNSTPTGGGAATGAPAPTAGATGGTAGGAVALLLPETKTTRYEAADRPYFEAALKTDCPSCTVIYSNANQDESAQLQQANAALAQGAKVLVLDPVNGKTAGAIVTAAKAKGVPVISYDRLITGGGDKPDYYISFDNEKVGQLQATELLKQVKAAGKPGQLVWINGSPTDNNATLFAAGAHSVIPKGTGADGYTIGYETATPEWSPATAQQEMSAAITQLGKDKIAGVYSANDGMATTIVAAMKNAGFTKLPPLTGQDAEKAAITRILTGEQSMTVYKAIKPEAAGAAELATALLNGQHPTTVGGVATQSTAAYNDVPSVLLTPVAVTRDTVKDTVIKDGFYTAADVCTGAAAAACTSLGIS